MTDQAIGLTHTASVPRGSIIGIARTERGVVPIQYGIVAGDFVSKFFGLLIVIEVPFTVVFPKSSSRMAGPTILNDVERGFVNFGGTSIGFLSQLARVGRGESMLSIHSRRKVPWVFRIEGITDQNSPKSVGSTLLEVVSVRYSIIVMTGATSLLRAIRPFAIRN